MKMSPNDVRRVSGPDGSIVLHLRRGTMFRVNPVGTKILDLLDQGVNPPQIAHQLSVELGAEFEVVQRDLQDFLERLQIHGVIDSLTEKP